jgi:UDP-galactopyranose mutase
MSSDPDGYSVSSPQENIFVVTPHLKESPRSKGDENYRVEKIISKLFLNNKIESPIFWYYTPMALNFTQNFTPRLIVYDLHG